MTVTTEIHHQKEKTNPPTRTSNDIPTAVGSCERLVNVIRAYAMNLILSVSVWHLLPVATSVAFAPE